jgi:hypothetical protein
MMKNLQKMGGIAAMYAGIAYIVGMIGFLLVVGWPDDPVQQVAVLVNNQVSQHILYLIVYQIWAVFLVVLTLALYERLKADSPAMMQTATAVQQSDITDKRDERKQTLKTGKRRKYCPESRNPHVYMRNPEPQGNFLNCEPPISKLNTLVDQTKVILFVT